jgi:protease secretion system outer membrane protein
MTRALSAWPLRSLGALALACMGGGAWGGDFSRAYQSALQNDAQYTAARFALESGRQAWPIARAAILPTVSATISDTLVQGSKDTESSSGSTSENLDYRAPSQSLNARVPLYNPVGLAGTDVAAVQVAAAESQFEVRRTELLERVTTAFLQRMLAEDVFNALHVQLQAAVEQRNLMRKRLERGEGTKTEVAEARASVSTIMAQWADARDQVINTRSALAAMTGEAIAPGTDAVVRLADDFKPPALEPAELPQWVLMALESSPTLRTKRQIAQMAMANVRRADAGHLPRLDLVANVNNARNETASSLNQTINQRSVGLQLSIPIYSGGQVVALAKQAIAEQSRAEAEVLNEQRAIELDVARLYQLVQNGTDKLESYVDAQEASQIAAEGARRRQLTGLRTNADVLEALRKAAQAQRDLAQARYDHVLQRIRLFNRSGIAAEKIVDQVDALLRRDAATAAQ